MAILATTAQPATAAEIPLRFVTAASLFDGHDASINIMRRVLQAAGVEVIHLGHNRSVQEIVSAAIQEGADAVAVSSYQGGHMEFYGFMVSMLKERGAPHIRVFGGGGGVIIAEEICKLHELGVTRIYSPDDGREIGLRGMIDDMVRRCQPRQSVEASAKRLRHGGEIALAQTLTQLSNATDPQRLANELSNLLPTDDRVPVIGVTGTGGAGKSSLTDELVRRFRIDFSNRLKIAVLAVDPSRRKSGGALLGDRIRMNAIDHENIFMRSLATRRAGTEIPNHLSSAIDAAKVAGYDLVIVETSGIGQGDAEIVPLVDISLYVMTPEFGAASQLEKIDMLDFADLVAINKFDRRGADDALRDVSKQLQRNHESFDIPVDSQPVYGTIASRFNDDGTSALYGALLAKLKSRGLPDWPEGGALTIPQRRGPSQTRALVPANRQRYLGDIADSVRKYYRELAVQADVVRDCQRLAHSRTLLAEAGKSITDVDSLIADIERKQTEQTKTVLREWQVNRERYTQEALTSQVRNRELRKPLRFETLSGTLLPKVSLPRYNDHGQLLTWLGKENLPGHFPFTAGVFELKREEEDPSRMFAGEGDAARTNQRFKYLSAGSNAKRLSTAFDSVTLYGCNPDEQPDIYGKVGNSGVSIATLDDMKVLYEGFDLSDPATSVSMTINGPAPTILAMFLNTAIDQKVASFTDATKRPPNERERQELRRQALTEVRGTVQADILKEDQGQNTCIFSTEFSLKVMGDIAEWFVENEVRNFYSVSISGYHIAEAGANPITQLALTLANGFTYVEAYLARGMSIDSFAPNFSFFFSNGMDPEYTVLGRVARRIWAIILRERYGADVRSQKLKYHIQTSGRSLHAQEIDFNDIRTTLQALIATYDNCNSLHTNAFDEAITTPTQASVRRALAIQMIINREWGLAKTENPNQGSFIIEELTDLVEEAVLQEFERLSERGGVLGAMETGYQRGKIQDESILYEHKKHDGTLPIVGVNTFLGHDAGTEMSPGALTRATEQEKRSQLGRLRDFHDRHQAESETMLRRLRTGVVDNENVFALLMDAVRCCSLGQITDALFEVGGKYRRSM